MSREWETHDYYTRKPRHYCPRSEAFTGADSLISKLRQGWTPSGRIYEHKVLFKGSRFTTVYYFELRRDGDMLTMPVVSNPYVQRLVHEMRLQIVRHDQTTAAEAVTAVIRRFA